MRTIDRQVAQQMVQKISTRWKETGGGPDDFSKDMEADWHLRDWFISVRRSIVLGTIIDDDVEFLNSLNFDFGVKPLTWMEWYSMLMEFNEFNPKGFIPDNAKHGQYCIGKWVTRQVSSTNRKNLTSKQKQMIENLEIRTSPIHDIKPYIPKITYEGREYDTISRLAQKLNIPEEYFEEHKDWSVDYIVYRYRWTKKTEEAKRREEARKKRNEIIYEGVIYPSKKELCKAFGITITSFERYYDKKDCSVAEAINAAQREIHTGSYAGHPLLYKERHYRSLDQLCNANGITRIDVFRKILRQSNSMEEAFECYNQWSKYGYTTKSPMVFMGIDFSSVRSFVHAIGKSPKDINDVLDELNHGVKPYEVALNNKESPKLKGISRNDIIEAYTPEKIVYDGVEFESKGELLDNYKVPYIFYKCKKMEGVSDITDIIDEHQKRQKHFLKWYAVATLDRCYPTLRSFCICNGLPENETEMLLCNGISGETIVDLFNGHFDMQRYESYIAHYKIFGFTRTVLLKKDKENTENEFDHIEMWVAVNAKTIVEARNICADKKEELQSKATRLIVRELRFRKYPHLDIHSLRFESMRVDENCFIVITFSFPIKYS